MTTTSDRLALLQRTKAGQRALLEGMYPDLDFNTVPFREYGRLFTGRKYVPGFVGGWKAYGRSNGDADRDVLHDYSGNGRDIRLYNFDFTENSGYSGGGLVSDGVDDYGQCVKGFALPDDYTVVTIRKMIGTELAALISKGADKGAFLFENYGNTWSYGQATNVSMLNYPLLSYQTKASYNGKAISVGDAVDDASDVLRIFNHNLNDSYKKAALYDLRIYDHSLTAEELQLVKDEMMSDYENATGGGINDITYVADWDGKGRSNDEEEPMRSQWIDKATGKVIDLNNYEFAAGSGWNGYPFNWSAWQSDIANNSGTVIRTQTSVRMMNTGNYPGFSLLYLNMTPNVDAFKIRVTGLKDNATLFFWGSGANFSTKKDGVYTINYATPLSSALNNFRLEGYSANEETDLLIEQLPLYPGALVSDGVDDYGQTQETVNENIGCVLLHYKRLVENPDKWGYYMDNLYSSRLFIAYETGGNTATNLSETIDDGKILTGEVGYTEAATEKLNIASNNKSIEKGKVAIYRLILIREQLDGAQVEFLRWKVEKEYRDWCIANGYDYAVNQLTE